MSEYGAHWNFFFTLAIVALATALLPLSGARAALAALTLSVAHQAALSLTALTPWLEGSKRDMSSLLDANKEGICSLPGYLALCYAGSAAASLLHSKAAPVAGTQTMKGDTSEHGAAVPARGAAWFGRLAWATAAAWAAMLLTAGLVQPVSRRFCNAPYVLWVVAMALTILLACAVAEVVSGVVTGVPTPGAVLCSLSEQQLAVFLLANVLTGLVNLSIDTLNASSAVTACVLAGYSLAWTLLPLGMRAWRQRQTKRRKEAVKAE